jgi:hypothetical protein
VAAVPAVAALRADYEAGLSEQRPPC